MNKLFHILSFFLFLSLNINSQGGFKKKYYFQNSLQSKCRNVFETPTGNFISIGITYDYTKNASCLTIVGADSEGTLLWRKDYGDTAFQYLDNILAPKGAIIFDHSGLYHSCIALDDTGTYCSVLIKFDLNGNMLWQKSYYSNESGVNLYVCGISQSIDDGILLTGLFEDFNLPQQPLLLMKVDKNGNELWRKKINKPTPNVNVGRGIVQDSLTKRIIVVGNQYLGSSSSNVNTSCVLITDSLGNKITQISFGNINTGGLGEIIQLKDGGFLSGGQWATSSTDYKSFLVKFNINGDVIWSKTLLIEAPYNTAGIFYELANYDIIMLGKSDYNNFMTPQLFCLDSAGETKWNKYIGSTQNPNNPEYFRSMNPTSDGGFIISTWFPYQQGSHPYSIIKVDSLGCDTLESYCKLISGQVELQSGFSFECFPVPADEKINFRIEAPVEKEFSIRLTDLTGKIVSEELIFPKAENDMDVSDFPSGIYFVHLIYEGNNVEVKKVTIVH